jgi:hypothetical protein
MDYPCWGYKIVKGKLESKIFDQNRPSSWSDSPKAAKAAKSKKKPEIVDDNSSRDNQQLSLASGDTGAESDVTRGNERGCVKPIESDVRQMAE